MKARNYRWVASCASVPAYVGLVRYLRGSTYIKVSHRYPFPRTATVGYRCPPLSPPLSSYRNAPYQLTLSVPFSSFVVILSS